MTDRRRNNFVLLIVLGLVILSLLVIVGFPGVTKAKKTRLGLDLKGGVELVYQGKPTAQSKVDSESLNRAIDIMRKRVDQLGRGPARNPALGTRRNRRRAARREQRLERAGRGGQDRAAVLLRLGAGRDRRRRQAGAERSHRDRRAAGRRRPVRAARVPGRAACRQTGADPAQERHDARAGLHAPAGGRLHLRQLVPARYQARKGAAGPRGNRTEPVRGQLQSRRPGRRSRRCASTPEPCSCRPGRWKARPARSRRNRPTAGT